MKKNIFFSSAIPLAFLIAILVIFNPSALAQGTVIGFVSVSASDSSVAVTEVVRISWNAGSQFPYYGWEGCWGEDQLAGISSQDSSYDGPFYLGSPDIPQDGAYFVEASLGVNAYTIACSWAGIESNPGQSVTVKDTVFVTGNLPEMSLTTPVSSDGGAPYTKDEIRFFDSTFTWEAGSDGANYEFSLYFGNHLVGQSSSNLSGSPETVTIGYSLNLVGNYKVCAYGESIAGSYTAEAGPKCTSITVSEPLVPSLDLDVKKTGSSDSNFGSSASITLDETVDLQWLSVGTTLGTCSKSADRSGAGWPISPGGNTGNDGNDINVGFSSTGTYSLEVACATNLGFDYKFVKIAHAQTPVDDQVTVTVSDPLPDGPDLMVNSTSYNPVPGELNESINILANIKNIGDATAGQSVSRIRVDKDNNGSWDYSDTETTSSLSSGASTNVSFSWSTNSSGTHRYEVCADNNGSISESNENNNCSISYLAVASGTPDLGISGTASVSPSTPTTGKNVSFSATTKNNGNATAGSSRTRLQIDEGNNGSWEYIIDRNTGSLASNGTESENWNNAWTAVIGTHKIRICADGLNDVIESNEGNNCATDVILVVTEALVVDLEVKRSGSGWSQSLTGEEPFNNIDLQGSVSGNSGNINYTFYCDRADSGTNVTLPFDHQANNQSSESYNIQNLCDYASQGDYNAKVIAERAGEFVEDRATITVTATSNGAPSSTNRSEVSGNACLAPLQPTFSWTFVDPDIGDSQSAYAIEVDDSPSFNSPAVDTGKLTSSSSSYVVPAGNLAFDETYYWRVKVWDSFDLEGNWSSDNSGDQVTTQNHAAPDPDFSWLPIDPLRDEVINFIDESIAFGGASITDWSWIFPGGSPSSSSAENPGSTFNSNGTKSVSLNITDSDDFSCSIMKNIEILPPAPSFKEVR